MHEVGMLYKINKIQFDKSFEITLDVLDLHTYFTVQPYLWSVDQ